MIRRFFVVLSMALVISACGGPTPSAVGADGQPLPKLYRIRNADTADVKFRMLDSVNSLRAAAAQPPVEFDENLTAAAATHARDMSVQNRPWHFGSDGSSPIDRARRVGYAGRLVGETISETYETELETLAAWMDQEDTRRVILSPDARDMGFAWYQERNGKIWWTLVMGNDLDSPTVVSGDAIF
ncbi:MAG: CAP domain-containing protein [Pseudomonadota bacterium]